MQTLKLLALALLLLNPILFLTGKDYVYKALLFQEANIDDLDLFPYRVITASNQPQPWPRSADYNQREIPEKLSQTLTAYRSVAFAVIHKGELVHDSYFDGYNSSTNSNSFSAGKSIVSAMVGRALQMGLIESIDQPVADFLPSFNTPNMSLITIRHMLQMASGLDFEEAYSKLISDTTEAYYGDDLDKLVARLDVKEAPGVSWQYRSGDTQVLAMVLESATGMSLSAFTTQSLWEPLGATQDAQWSLDSEGGIEKAFCCFYSNALDFARVGQLYLNNGRVGGNQLISESFVEESFRSQNIPSSNTRERADYYGLHWWRLNYQNVDVFYMRGILGQYVWVIPERNIVAVRLGHERSKVKRGGHPEDVYAYLDGIFKMFPSAGEEK